MDAAASQDTQHESGSGPFGSEPQILSKPAVLAGLRDCPAILGQAERFEGPARTRGAGFCGNSDRCLNDRALAHPCTAASRHRFPGPSPLVARRSVSHHQRLVPIAIESLPGTVASSSRSFGGARQLPFAIPLLRRRELQMVAHAEDHNLSTQPEVVQEPIRDAHTTCAIKWHSCRSGKQIPIEPHHFFLRDQPALEPISLLLKLLLWPEPERSVLSRSGDECLAMPIRLPSITQLRRDGQSLLRVERVFVLAEKHELSLPVGQWENTTLRPTFQHPHPLSAHFA